MRDDSTLTHDFLIRMHCTQDSQTKNRKTNNQAIGTKQKVMDASFDL